MTAPTLSRRFYAQPTTQVARELLGCKLISTIDRQRAAGIIVETEAYLHDDPACHANKARTNRTEVMFGPAGIAYVYPIHAKFCFNIVTEKREIGCAVLIRALEPTKGIEVMKSRRGVDDLKRQTTGPACLCQALGIDRSISGCDLTRSDSVWIEPAVEKVEESEIGVSVRIGVTSGETLPLRFYLRGNSFVSGPKRMRQ